MWATGGLRRAVVAVLLVAAFGLIVIWAWRGASRKRPTPIPSPSPSPGASRSPSAVYTVVPTPDKVDEYKMRRESMVRSQIGDRGVKDKDVLRAMETVPRHEFVPSEYVRRAYEDTPLPIGYGQTISQPYIVAVMTELLRLHSQSKVLEIGSGSGYQAAILAKLTQEVYTVEIVEALCHRAKETLKSLGYGNVEVKCGDGYYGWEEHAPYDAIIVTCAPDHIPQPLVNQLADGGRMVIPVGPPGLYQVLWLIERAGEEVKSQRVMGVTFVPLTRGQQ